MKFEFKSGGAAKTLKILKKNRLVKAVISAESSLLASADGPSILREAADLCIERGQQVLIEGVSPCLMPGYSRYLAAAGKGSLACPRKVSCFLNNTCSGIPAKHAAIMDAFKPPARPLTDLEKCMLAVLARKDRQTTAQVLKTAKGIKICASCSNEGEVFRAAERLIRFGLVSKEYSGGVYIWSKKRD